MNWATFGTIIVQGLIGLVLLFVVSAVVAAVVTAIRGDRPGPAGGTRCPCCGKQHTP